MVSNIRLFNQSNSPNWIILRIFPKFTFNSWILLQARCIADVKADTDHTSFLTGTLSLKEEIEVFISKFDLRFAFLCSWWFLITFPCYLLQVHLIRLLPGGTETCLRGFVFASKWDMGPCFVSFRVYNFNIKCGFLYLVLLFIYRYYVCFPNYNKT